MTPAPPPAAALQIGSLYTGYGGLDPGTGVPGRVVPRGRRRRSTPRSTPGYQSLASSPRPVRWLPGRQPGLAGACRLT